MGRRIAELKLPRNAAIGAIVRNEAVLIARPDLIIEPEDHVIMFLADKNKVREIERLFQVSATFI